MTGRLSEAEFTTLRQTIAWRVTVRMVLVPVTVIGWGALSLTLLLSAAPAVAVVLPLLVLVAGFEAVHALHVGAERIGRYLQVYYEGDAHGPRWETTAMAVGPVLPGGGIDPLFSAVFISAAAANLLPAVAARLAPTTLLLVAALHAVVVFRVIRLRSAAARQRAVELESFTGLKGQDAP